MAAKLKKLAGLLLATTVKRHDPQRGLCGYRFSPLELPDRHSRLFPSLQSGFYDQPGLRPCLGASGLSSSSSRSRLQPSASSCQHGGDLEPCTQNVALADGQQVQNAFSRLLVRQGEAGQGLSLIKEIVDGSSSAQHAPSARMLNGPQLQHDIKKAEAREDSAQQNKKRWNSREVFNWPNAISFGRLVSGPALAWLIIEGLTQPALVGLILAGISDWLDGYIARKKNIDSVVGTYLDPLADKVLIGCVAVSMAYAGYLHPALVTLVIARDAALVGGSLVLRADSLNWKWKSMKDFFNIAEVELQKVKPLFVSKVNTVLQLALVGTALVQPAFGLEDAYSLVPNLSWCVAFTTCLSWVAYCLKLFPKKVNSSVASK